MVIIFSCKTEKPKVVEDKLEVTTDIANLEKEALAAYAINPLSALPLFDSLSTACEKANNLAKQAITELNMANIYDEHAQKFTRANYHAHKSLAIWETLNDTMQMANLLKYSGYINGELGNFEIGKRQIDKAIEFYNIKNFEEGKAVSYFNMARVIFLEGNYKSCEQFFRLSKSYWLKKNNVGRVIPINDFGIKLYSKLGDDKMIEKLKLENQAFINK